MRHAGGVMLRAEDGGLCVCVCVVGWAAAAERDGYR